MKMIGTRWAYKSLEFISEMTSEYFSDDYREKISGIVCASKREANSGYVKGKKHDWTPGPKGDKNWKQLVGQEAE